MPLPLPPVVRNLSLTREFDDLSDEQIQPFIEGAAEHVSEASARDRYPRLVALLAAHMIVDRKRGGAGAVRPEIVSERLGPMQRSYQQGQQTTTTSWLRLAGTSYGREFAALIELVPTGPTALYSAEDLC